jgi:L-ascorbate metabolism protein UlaG (beta-lactamase superfamily)
MRQVTTLAGLVFFVAVVSHAQNVRVTPLGARTGEFCSPDRAILFEDPTGVRILFDPATTISGGTDPRLGAVHAVLVSHAHGDHIGNAQLNQDPDSPAAACASGVPVTSTPNSNAAGIAVAKNAAVIVAPDLATFMSRKLQNILASPAPACPASGANNEMIVPATQPCVGNLGYGAKRTLRSMSAQSGVQIAVIPATHGNGVPADEISDPLRTQLATDNLSFAPGQASSYIVRFTNGMTAFLSGDTGLTTEMSTVVSDYYAANFAVFNMGDIFTTGPEEAAFAINRMIRPETVIPSHANEQATQNGNVLAGTKTAHFMDLVRTANVIPPLSGAVMEFDGHGRCVTGCPGKASGGGNDERARPAAR